MILLYHEFNKNANTIFPRGMIYLARVRCSNVKINYFLQFS